MARKRGHKDVEFHIDHRTGTKIFKTFAEAANFAVLHALAGSDVDIDVVVWSQAGAKWLSGADGVAQYREDPEASVFERVRVRAWSLGRVA